MKGQSCEFDDGKPYQLHAAEFMVARRDSDGKFKGPMFFCLSHFFDYSSTLKDDDAESGKGDEAVSR